MWYNQKRDTIDVIKKIRKDENLQQIAYYSKHHILNNSKKMTIEIYTFRN